MIPVRLAITGVALAALIGCSKDEPTKPTPRPPVQVSFAAPVPIAATGLAGTLSSFLVTDLNDDAIPDLAVGMTDSSSIWVRFGTGGGAFAPGTTFPCGVHPYAVAAANVTGSSINDLVVGGDGAIIMLRALSGNQFAQPDTLLRLDGGTVRGITCSDFDRDGATDIAFVVDFVDAGGTLLETDVVVISSLTRTVTQIFQTFGEILASGDADGDRYPDLVIAGGTTPGVVAVYWGKGNGTFSTATVSAMIGDNPLGVAGADLDIDGAEEFGIAHGDTPGIWTVHYAPHLDDLETDSSYASATTASAIASGDLNLDGQPDFAASSLTSADVAVLVNNWNGKLQHTLYFPTGGASSRVAIADVDGDGRKDVIVAGPTSADGIRYLKNTSQ